MIKYLRKQFEEVKTYLDSWFLIETIVSIVYGSTVKQNVIMVYGHDGVQLLTSWQLGYTSLMTYIFQSIPPPNRQLSHEPINESINWWTWSLWSSNTTWTLLIQTRTVLLPKVLRHHWDHKKKKKEWEQPGCWSDRGREQTPGTSDLGARSSVFIWWISLTSTQSVPRRMESKWST